MTSQTDAPASAACPKCGRSMRPAVVKTAIWRDERLFVIEDIPAQVCDGCMEQFYDEETTNALRRVVEEDGGTVPPKREIVVPVFSLEGRIIRRVPSPDEQYQDY